MSAATEVRMTCHGCGAELPPSTGRRKWCSDRCRKRTLYSRPCADCGTPLNGTGGRGPNAPTRCVPCASKVSGADRKVWTREAIVAAIREWAVENGEPPAGPDWSPHQARRFMHDDARARRFEDAGGRWPSTQTVFDEFGSWQAAITAAGYQPRAPHGGGGNVARRRSQRNPSKGGSLTAPNPGAVGPPNPTRREG